MTNVESRVTPTYHGLEALRRTHPAWKLLRGDYAPLVVGFLSATFVGAYCRLRARTNPRRHVPEVWLHNVHLGTAT